MSEPIDNGGPAFPVPFEAFHQGATLLDYFAGQALPALIEDCVLTLGDAKPDASELRSIAVTAYGIADRMIAEKRRREPTI